MEKREQKLYLKELLSNMELLKSYNVCFLGRTGNGKSSLINELWNVKFSTDPLLPCTKEMYAVTKKMNDIAEKEAVTVYDTPGIGEFSSDAIYERFYQQAVAIADCIVLVSTFDRTDAPAQRLLEKLKPFINSEKNVRFVIALNHIDSRIITDTNNTYEPWNEDRNTPTEECLKNIEKRIDLIHKRFRDRFIPFNVIPVCAMRKYGIDKLKQEILGETVNR